MIITIGSYKGGTGKSTIATNLATEFHRRGTKVILIEADPIVGTSSQWAADREENGYDTIPVVRKTGRLKKTLEDFAKTYDVVIVDAPGKDSVELRSAAVVSDLLVVPTAPTTPDLDSTRGFLASMDEARHINSNASKKPNITRRPRNLDTLQTIYGDPEAFLNGAEKQNLNIAEETRARLRSRGDKINIYVIRGTKQQRELLKHAAEKENTSMQKLIWDRLIFELEEKYGQDLPLNNL